MVNRFIFFIILSILLFAEKPKLMLLKTYKEQNITGWVMSEKLDGIRGILELVKILIKVRRVGNYNYYWFPEWVLL